MLRAVVDTNVVFVLVTNNVRDFSEAAERFGFPVLRPERFLAVLNEEAKP